MVLEPHLQKQIARRLEGAGGTLRAANGARWRPDTGVRERQPVPRFRNALVAQPFAQQVACTSRCTPRPSGSPSPHRRCLELQARPRASRGHDGESYGVCATLESFSNTPGSLACAGAPRAPRCVSHELAPRRAVPQRSIAPHACISSSRCVLQATFDRQLLDSPVGAPLGPACDPRLGAAAPLRARGWVGPSHGCLYAKQYSFSCHRAHRMGAQPAQDAPVGCHPPCTATAVDAASTGPMGSGFTPRSVDDRHDSQCDVPNRSPRAPRQRGASESTGNPWRRLKGAAARTPGPPVLPLHIQEPPSVPADGGVAVGSAHVPATTLPISRAALRPPRSTRRQLHSSSPKRAPPGSCKGSLLSNGGSLLPDKGRNDGISRGFGVQKSRRSRAEVARGSRGDRAGIAPGYFDGFRVVSGVVSYRVFDGKICRARLDVVFREIFCKKNRKARVNARSGRCGAGRTGPERAHSSYCSIAASAEPVGPATPDQRAAESCSVLHEPREGGVHRFSTVPRPPAALQ